MSLMLSFNFDDVKTSRVGDTRWFDGVFSINGKQFEAGGEYLNMVNRIQYAVATMVGRFLSYMEPAELKAHTKIWNIENCEFEVNWPNVSGPKTTRLIFNFDHLEEANNETTATTYYGGYFTVNGKTFYAYGNDRGEGIDYQVDKACEVVIGRKLEYFESEVWMDEHGSEARSGVSCTLEIDWPSVNLLPECAQWLATTNKTPYGTPDRGDEALLSEQLMQKAIDTPVDEFRSMVTEAIKNDAVLHHLHTPDMRAAQVDAYELLKTALKACREAGYQNPMGLVADVLGDIGWSKKEE